MACVVGIMVCYLLGEVSPSCIGRETAFPVKRRVPGGQGCRTIAEPYPSVTIYTIAMVNES